MPAPPVSLIEKDATTGGGPGVMSVAAGALASAAAGAGAGAVAGAADIAVVF